MNHMDYLVIGLQFLFLQYYKYIYKVIINGNIQNNTKFQILKLYFQLK